MACRVESASRGDEYIVPESDPGSVENHAVEVHEEVFSDFNVVAVVALERGAYLEVFACLSEKLPDECLPFCRLCRGQGIEFKAFCRPRRHFGEEFRVIACVIQHSCCRLFFFCHCPLAHGSGYHCQ